MQRELALGALGATAAGALVAGTPGTLEGSIVTEGAGFDGLGGCTGVAGGGRTATVGGATGGGTSVTWGAGGEIGMGWLGVGSGAGLAGTGRLGGSTSAVAAGGCGAYWGWGRVCCCGALFSTSNVTPTTNVASMSGLE